MQRPCIGEGQHVAKVQAVEFIGRPARRAFLVTANGESFPFTVEAVVVPERPSAGSGDGNVEAEGVGDLVRLVLGFEAS